MPPRSSMMDKIFKDIYTSELVRDKTSRQLTFNNNFSDSLFNLQQDLPSFFPEKESIENLVSATYLYGLFGYVATNFTCVNCGFLATYKNGEDVATILICDDNTTYYVEPLLEMCNNKIEDEQLPDMERKFFASIKSLLSSRAYPLLVPVSWSAEMLNKVEELSYLKDNLQQAFAPFSSEENSVNSQNHINNLQILRDFCCAHLNFPPEDLTQQQQDQVQQMQTNISEFCHTYITQSSGNEQSQIDKIKDFTYAGKPLQNPKQLNAIITMFSTDQASRVVTGMYHILDQTKDGTACLTQFENMDIQNFNAPKQDSKRDLA